MISKNQSYLLSQGFSTLCSISMFCILIIHYIFYNINDNRIVLNKESFIFKFGVFFSLFIFIMPCVAGYSAAKNEKKLRNIVILFIGFVIGLFHHSTNIFTLVGLSLYMIDFFKKTPRILIIPLLSTSFIIYNFSWKESALFFVVFKVVLILFDYLKRRTLPLVQDLTLLYIIYLIFSHISVQVWPILPWFSLVFLGYYIGLKRIYPFSMKEVCFFGLLFFLSFYFSFNSFLNLMSEYSLWTIKVYNPPVSVLILIISFFLFIFSLLTKIKTKNIHFLADSSIVVYILMLASVRFFVSIPFGFISYMLFMITCAVCYSLLLRISKINIRSTFFVKTSKK